MLGFPMQTLLAIRRFKYTTYKDVRVKAKYYWTYLWNEYEFKAKLYVLANYSINGLLVWIAVNRFNTWYSYGLIILLAEYYVPWLVSVFRK